MSRGASRSAPGAICFPLRIALTGLDQRASGVAHFLLHGLVCIQFLVTRGIRLPISDLSCNQSRNYQAAGAACDQPMLGATAMSSAKQRTAARKNVRKAATAAKSKRTIAHLDPKTRHALGKQGAKMAKRAKRG